MPEGDKPGGLFTSLSRIAESFAALAENRFRLFASELEGEKLRFLDTLLKLAIALGVIGIGFSLATFTLALYVWRVARFGGLIAMAAFFLGVGSFLLWRLREQTLKNPPLFEKTLNEFRKDRECSTRKD